MRLESNHLKTCSISTYRHVATSLMLSPEDESIGDVATCCYIIGDASQAPSDYMETCLRLHGN